MAQVQQDTVEGGDAIAQAFVVDRQAFWNRFTRFTVWAVLTVAIVLIGMWLFLA